MSEEREQCDDCYQEFDADELVAVERHPLYSLTGEPEYDWVCSVCYQAATMTMSATGIERARRFSAAVSETARRMLEGEAVGPPIGIFGEPEPVVYGRANPFRCIPPEVDDRPWPRPFSDVFKEGPAAAPTLAEHLRLHFPGVYRQLCEKLDSDGRPIIDASEAPHLGAKQQAAPADSQNREGDGGVDPSGREELTAGGSQSCAPAGLALWRHNAR